MAALTHDVHKERYGAADDTPYNFPIAASTTVYRGSIALTSVVANVTALKNAATPASTDICWGVIDQAGPESVNTGPGIVNGSSVSGVVTADVATGTFFLASGTGADQLSSSSIGSTVYVIDEVTVGLTTGGGTRPIAGVHVYTEAQGRFQAPGNYAIKLGSTGSGVAGGP